MIEFYMNVQQAIEAPNGDPQFFRLSPFPHTMYPAISLSSRVYPNRFANSCALRGHKLRVTVPGRMGRWRPSWYRSENRRAQRRNRSACGSVAWAW